MNNNDQAILKLRLRLAELKELINMAKLSGAYNAAERLEEEADDILFELSDTYGV